MANSARKLSSGKSLGRTLRRLVFGSGSLPWVCPSFLLFCVLLLCSFPALAQSPQPSGAPNATAQEPSPAEPLGGTISGTVGDRTGAVIPGARVKLSREDSSLSQETMSDSDGQFYFAGVAPGKVELPIAVLLCRRRPGVLPSHDYLTRVHRK